MKLKLVFYGFVLAATLLAFPIMASNAFNFDAFNKNDKTNDTDSNRESKESLKLITVSKAEFGVQRVGNDGHITLIPTSIVPFQEGRKYGWRIQLKEYKGKITWREVIRLPKKPQTWATQYSQNFSISPNGTEAITERTEYIDDGVITNFWTIATGDPLGRHVIEIYINKRKIAAFQFQIVTDRKEQKK